MTPADEIWAPEPIFAGRTVLCLASGPSLTQEVADYIRDNRRGAAVVAVNSSCILAPWADVLYFTDSGWYEGGPQTGPSRRELVANWPGLVVTMSKTAKREQPQKCKRIEGRWDPLLPMPGFPPLGSHFVVQGRSSGHTAVSMSVAMGRPPIIGLVGYDSRVVDGVEHCHAEYSGPRDLEQYAREFVPAWAGWRAAAAAVDVEILNLTPGSAITEFPFADLKEVLKCAA